jgi:hypothetical protein
MRQIISVLSSLNRPVSVNYPTPIAAEPTFIVESTKIVSQTSGRFLARACSVVYDGITYLTYIERTDHGVGDPTIHIKFSDDYGATWTNEDTYLDGNPVSGFPYTDTLTGRYLVRIVKCPDGSLAMPRSKFGVSFRSVDNGKTWTQYTVILPAATPDDYGADPGLNDFEVTLGGRIYWPMKYFQFGYNDGSDVNYVNRLTWAYSDDNCATFQGGQTIAWWPIPPTYPNFAGANPPTKGADEPMLTYHGGGLFRMAGRTTNVDAFYGWKLPNYGEGDVTITNLQSQINWAAGRLSGHQRAKLKGQSEWQTDPVLFAFGFEFTTPSSGDDRRHCFIASKDKGVTWIGPYYLDVVMHDGGYGDVTYDPINDEYIFISYYELNSGDKAVIKQYNVKIDWA